MITPLVVIPVDVSKPVLRLPLFTRPVTDAVLTAAAPTDTNDAAVSVPNDFTVDAMKSPVLADCDTTNEVKTAFVPVKSPVWKSADVKAPVELILPTVTPPLPVRVNPLAVINPVVSKLPELMPPVTARESADNWPLERTF